MNTLDYAKFYATQEHWQIFPVQPGHKEPAVKWADEATTDESKIAGWFAQSSYNIGIATGARSGIVVVDIDAAHGGEESYTALTSARKMPATATAKTGGGGRHLIFAHPGVEIRNSASKLAPGIDIRGDGGYIVAPPSLHPSGNRYEWVRELAPSKTPLAQMPDWMVESLTRVTTLEYPQAVPQPLADSGNGAIGSGSRNQTLTSLAGTMRRRGMGEEAIYTALLAENKNKCVPPLPPNEVAAIAASVCRYSPTAAPVMRNRERVQNEWAFAKALFMLGYSGALTDFLHLTPDQFTDDNIRAFWACALETNNIYQAVEKSALLPDLESVVSDPMNIDIYARQIARFDYLGNIAKAAQELQRVALSGDEEKTGQLLEAIADSKQVAPQTARTASESLDELTHSIVAGRDFVKTGFGNLDDITGGLERKTLSILAARPSMGKTTIAWQLARTIAAGGKRVLFLSLEVTAVSLWRKAALGLAEVSSADLENGKVSDAKKNEITTRIIPELKSAYDGRLFVYDEPPYTLGALSKVIAQIAPDVIICDHLGYVDDNTDRMVERLGKITKWAKAQAKKTNSHFMMLCQLNRDVEKRDRKEPHLSDIRESGNIEEDADMVIMPYRPAYYADNPVPMRYSETQLYIRKNRDNRLGTLGLYMDMLHQWFYRRNEVPDNYASVRL